MTESPEQPRPFKWSAYSERAAFLIAEGRISQRRIAAQCHVVPGTITEWKRHPEFLAQVRTHQAEIRESIKNFGLSQKDARRQRYNNRLEDINQLFLERGEDMEGEVPGGGTGLLVRVPKSVTITVLHGPSEIDGKPITVRQDEFEYRPDTALIREERELLKQVAIEEGQFTEKQELSGTGGGPLTVVFAAREDGPS